MKISNRTLAIATVWQSAKGLRLDETRSAMFELAGREQADLLQLANEVSAYCTSKRIHELIVKAPLPKGSHAGSGLGFKIEAVLQLIPAIRVELIASNSTSFWLKREAPDLPDADREHLKPADAKLQLEAIRVAAHHWMERRVLSEILSSSH